LFVVERLSRSGHVGLLAARMVVFFFSSRKIDDAPVSGADVFCDVHTSGDRHLSVTLLTILWDVALLWKSSL